MEEEFKSQRKFIFIIAFSFLVYLLNIATKNLYTSEIVEIIKEFQGATKAKAALATTFYFIPYAVVQVFLSRFIKRINLLKTFLVTTVLSIVIFALIPFCTNLRQIYAFFAINGVLQAFTWPSIVYITTNYLPDSFSAKFSALVGVAYTIGFVVDYAAASFFIKYFTWKIGFWFFCVVYLFSMICLMLLVFSSEKIEDKKKKMVLVSSGETISSVKSNIAYFYVVTCIGCLISSVIFYGVQGWIAPFFNDVFHISSSKSALITMFVPIVAVAGPIIGASLSEKMNYWKVLVIITAICTVLLLTLVFVLKMNIIISLVLLALIIVCARAIGIIFSTVSIMKSKSFMDTGSMASLTNSFSSVGAALGPIMVGFFIDKTSYGLSFGIVALFCLISVLIVLIPYKMIKHFAE